MIAADRLRKSFRSGSREIRAVEDVSFRALDGQVTGLLGPNGAGKTTTLRMLYTLMQPDAGRVLVDGIDASRDPSGARVRLGVLPDARGLYKRLTARENIEYFGRLQGVSPALLAGRIDRLSAALEMRDVLDRRVEGFSQGQRLKTALARALVHDPPNVLLDEPASGLDVMTTRALRRMLQGLKAEGRCILFSSHLMPEVAQLCDRIVIIARGRVVAEGTPDEIRVLAGLANLEDAFVKVIGTDEGLFA